MITLTTEQLMAAARYIADALVEDVKAFTVPADVETWGELHDWVDANEYAMNAFADLKLYITDEQLAAVYTNDNDAEFVDERNGRDYENMTAAEEVAFAVFRLTADLDEYRAMVKEGFRLIHEFKTFVKNADKVFRLSHEDRDLRINVETPDGDYWMAVRLKDIKG